ncbi:DUF4350 domain-containing protein [Halorubellus litoreus]|uniref:DUF4350 domain-containing protein n=1 Tax=Halorubellus litoreus TaxID=755308 RepID=A0ABD5VEW8_9EURY
MGGDATAGQAPAGERTGTVVDVQDGDTITVEFEDGTTEDVRLLGVDAPERAVSRQFERPEEWEGLAYREDRSLLQLRFDSVSSLHAPDGTPLSDDSVVAVRSESTARVEDTDGEGPTVATDGEIPLVAVSGRVVGFGAIMVDGAPNFDEDNEEFLLNVWDEVVGSGTVLWDEGHDQFFDTEEVEAFPTHAEDHGYSVRGTTSLVDDLPDADALVVTSPSKAFSDAELDAVASFVDDGGAVFLHNQADYNDFDATGNHNAIADALDLEFRFGDDQVLDDEHNGGQPFVPTTRNFSSAFASFFRDREGIDGVPARSSEHLLAAAEDATAFARDRLADETVTLAFDGDEPTRDGSDRLLAYVRYEDDDGEQRRFNRELVANGLGRVFDSGFAAHREFQRLEREARAAGRGVWTESDVSSAPSYRNRRVESLYFPAPASVRTMDGQLPRDRAPVRAMSTATQDGSPAVPYDVGIPLVGVDPESRVALVGAPLVDERYEALEGYGVDTSTYENHAFLTNLAAALADRDGDVLVDGAHGQYAAAHAPAAEQAAYYQRYLEGQGLNLEQRNEVTAETLGDARALVVATPASSFSPAELDALASFRDAGGAVVLLGSGAVERDRLEYLNDVAGGLGSDLRFNADAVTDAANGLGGDPAVFETRSFARPYGGLFEAFDGTASLPGRAAQGGSTPGTTPETTSPATTTFPAVDASSGPLDGLLVPGAVAAGGLATVLAALGLRRGGGARDDEAVTDGGDAR